MKWEPVWNPVRNPVWNPVRKAQPPSNYKYKCEAVGCNLEFKLLIDRTEHVRLAHLDSHQSAVNSQSSYIDRHIEIPCENCGLRHGYSMGSVIPFKSGKWDNIAQDVSNQTLKNALRNQMLQANFKRH